MYKMRVNLLVTRESTIDKKVSTAYVNVRSYWRERERDMVSRWVHKESNLIFTLSSDKDQKKKIVFAFAFALH